jgi:hypothetical protein
MSRYICGFKVNYPFAFILLFRFVDMKSSGQFPGVRTINVTKRGGGLWVRTIGEASIV